MIFGFLELADPILSSSDAHVSIANNFEHQKLEKPKLTDFIYCSALHKFESLAGIGKRPSIWLNLDFLKSLGPKEWEKLRPPGF